MLKLKNALEDILRNDIEYYENKSKQFEFIKQYYDENEILNGMLDNIDLYKYYEMTWSLKPKSPDRMISIDHINKQNNGKRIKFYGGSRRSDYEGWTSRSD